MNELLVLYANCILVKGAARSVICDLQRAKVYPVPNSMHALFDAEGHMDIAGIRKSIADTEKPVLDEYLEFLEEQELVFSCTRANAVYYPRLPLQWEFPATISNCIIDADVDTAYINAGLFEQLAGLCCNYIEFRFFNPVDNSWLEQLLQGVQVSQVKAISLVITAKEDPGFDQWIVQLMSIYTKIQFVILHAHAHNEGIPLQEPLAGRYIHCTSNKLSALHCGNISTDYFSINIPAFMESLQFNTCLNRKISIDARGAIKNCPSMTESFGNIRNTTLAEALSHPEFKRYWNIKKDNILICRDCEFRYICTDCRAYLEEPENDYSKPLKCGYDPYTCTWQEWSIHPLKHNSMVHYGMPLPSQE
jgi:SPASM domain peptide maturase of grasp-with-spasm system